MRIFTIIQIYWQLLTTVGLKRILSSFLIIFGTLWLLIEPAALFFPQNFNLGWIGYLGLVSISLAISFIKCFPRKSIYQTLSSPDSTIGIKIGDLFDEPRHLVIGANDVFDTELGEIIKPSSVQGQFLNRIYDNDLAKLDAEIDQALENYKARRIKENNKIRGKSWRYPISTTITLGTPENRYFWTAYGYMGNDLKVTSNADYIWSSLSSLWEEVRRKGHGLEVAIPVVGADLARTGLPRMALVKLIVISFVIASKKEFVSRKLTVMIYPKDLKNIDFYELEDFLTSACF
ncbi:MAG: macro domain-containing protein [Cyanobacteria bacterium P01_F01_bin.143]